MWIFDCIHTVICVRYECGILLDLWFMHWRWILHFHNCIDRRHQKWLHWIWCLAQVGTWSNAAVQAAFWINSVPFNNEKVSVRVENWRRHLTFSFFSFRCVCNLADIVQPIFMIVFGANFVTICVAMLSIQIGMVVKSKLIFVEWILQEKIETFFLLKLQSQSNLMLLATSILELLGTFTFLFVPGELAGRISSRFEDINDLITQFDWYLFPQEVKQTLPLIMINSQQEVGFTCLGSFLCNRATFKKVSRT